MKQTKSKIKSSKLYKWVSDYFLTFPVLMSFLILLGLLLGINFWFPLTQDYYGFATNHWNNHGINNWVLGILLFVIWELLYVWVCKNEKEIKKDEDIIFAKVISLWLTYLIFTVIIPFIIMGYGFIISIDWLSVSLGLGYVIGLVVGIAAVLLLFYKSNQLIFHMIRGY